MARRKRGSVRERGKGKWLVRVYVGKDPSTGRRKYVSKTVYGKKRKAEQVRTQMLHELDTNKFVEPSNTNLSEFIKRWLKTKEGEVEETTWNDYESRMRLDVMPTLGSLKLQDIEPLQIKELYSELQNGRRNLSNRTIRYTHMILNQALGQALEWDMISKNPCASISPPKKKKVQHIQPLTKEQTRKLLDWSKANQRDFWPLWTLLVTSGLRPGEAVALKWNDVNLDEQNITVNAAMTKTKSGTWTRKGFPKNSSSRRQVALPKSTVGALREHKKAHLRRQMEQGIRTGLVFTNRAGSPWDRSKVRREWLKACDKAEDVPTVRLYDARHTHATHLLQAEVNPKIVAERLGHSSIKMTLDVYSHLIPSMQKQTAEKVEEALFG